MFQGAITAIVTPFKQNGDLDEQALKNLVEFQIKNRIDGIVPCGTTGESPTLEHEEHKRVVETVVETANGKTKIIAGAGLDVLEGECYIREEKQILNHEFQKECDLRMVLKNHLLLKQPNVLITPHNAFNSLEALKRILDTAILNINSFLKKKPVNIVKWSVPNKLRIQ